MVHGVHGHHIAWQNALESPLSRRRWKKKREERGELAVHDRPVYLHVYARSLQGLCRVEIYAQRHHLNQLLPLKRITERQRGCEPVGLCLSQKWRVHSPTYIIHPVIFTKGLDEKRGRDERERERDHVRGFKH